MTFPGPTTFPGSDTFPGSSDYVPGTPTIPYLSIGSWSSSGVDADGALWRLGSLVGWDEPAPVRDDNSVPRSNADGSFDGPVFGDERVITWTGSVVTPDRLGLAVAKRKLSQVARALRSGVDLIGHMEDGDYTVHVKRASGWNGDELGWLGWQYQAVVTCRDPFKYGPLVIGAPTPLPSAGTGGLVFPLFNGTGFLEFGPPGNLGQATLFNAGTAEAWPTFEVIGSVLGGIVLTETITGRRIVFPDDVPLTGVLGIDSATGRATLNGADRTGRLTVKQWFSVPPGGSITVQFATLGPPGQSGYLIPSLRSTYE